MAIYWLGENPLELDLHDVSSTDGSIPRQLTDTDFSKCNTSHLGASWNSQYFATGRCVKEFKSDGSSSVVMDLEALSPVGGCDRPVNVSPEVKIGCVAAAWNRLCISVTESVVMESTATQPSHRLVIVDGTHSADPGKRRVSALPLSDTFTSLACCDHTTVAVDDCGIAWHVDHSIVPGGSNVTGEEPGHQIGKQLVHSSCQRATLSLERICWPLGVSSVACGKDHVVLLDKAGRVATFGIGSRGQLGHGHVTTLPAHDIQVVEALDGVRCLAVAAGGWHSLALMESGDLYSWGWNESGQLGVGNSSSTIEHGTGPNVAGEDQLSGQESTPHTTARESQLGTVRALPCLVNLPESLTDIDDGPSVMSIACGSRHSAALTDDCQVLTWGWGAYGQLGHTERRNYNCPTIVKGLADEQVCSVSCGDWFTIVRCQPS